MSTTAVVHNSYDFLHVCIDCLVKDTWLLLPYSLLVFVLWGITSFQSKKETNEIALEKLPRSPGDMPIIFHGKAIARCIRYWSISKARKLMKLFQVEKLYSLVSIFVFLFEKIYGVRGNAWDYLRAFKTALVFYFILIPLPAAFMPPVGHQQVEPSLQLMVATILLIFINAIGDMFSVNFSVRIFRTAIENLGKADHQREPSKKFRTLFSYSTNNDIKRELAFYLTVLVDLIAATVFLILVLMGSSIMFGIQVGEFKFSLDRQTLSLMLDSALHFWRLAGELYWFPNDSAGFMGQPGIPGMLAFSITTFIPTLIIGLSAIIWLCVLPIRIVFTKKMGRYSRLVVAQVVVSVICVIYTSLAYVNLETAYAFLITT